MSIISKCLFFGLLVIANLPLLSEEIMVTLPAYFCIAEELAQGVAKVGSLVCPEEGHHPSFITPEKLECMKNAKVWFGVGSALEDSLLSVISDDVVYVDLQNCSSVCNTHDPHFWLSPSCLKEQAELMCETLISIFQEKQEQLQENLSKVLDDIEMTRQEIRTLLGEEKVSFICSHDALRYFCNEFTIDYTPFDANGYDPSFSDLEELVQKVEHSAPSLLVLIEGHHEDLGHALSESLNLPVFLFNPNSKNVLGQLTSLAKALVQNNKDMDE
ncbi:metal ABC transporter substrate-binding protein [Candidatus Similichlamydia epinepheli]|uniref:metal ABC transporter substrate-binding protein n=1 Tax=Candidatus Similichlamydia epinepheli TaxID=1903953 RepID=UPI001300A877|nr:zinc ABC transporter substrate-binding protein [Candidatus Similichlamydia epinepheli]